MTKKLLGVFTAIVTALAVVGVAWAGTDAATSTSNSAKTSARAALDGSSQVDSSGLTARADLDASTSATVGSSTSATIEDDDDLPSSTSTSVEASASTSVDGTTSTSVDDDDDDQPTFFPPDDDDQSTTSTSSTTSTTIDDDDEAEVPDGITTHVIPGVGTVTIEASAGQLFLVSVSAPGWNVETEKLEADRIRLEFTNELDAEAEFEARINNGRVEVRSEVDSG